MTYYAFLRAVNVGSSAKVDMLLLKRHIKETYDIPIETYKNSGNVIIKEPGDRKGILTSIKESINDLFGIDIAVLGRDKDQLNHYLAKNPFVGPEYEKSKALLYLVEDEVEKDRVLDIGKREGIIEKYWYDDKVLYAYYVNGVGRSKLTTAFIENVLKSRVTGRNVNTIEELVSKW